MGLTAFFLKPKHTLPGVVRDFVPGHSHKDLNTFADLRLLEIPVFGL